MQNLLIVKVTSMLKNVYYCRYEAVELRDGDKGTYLGNSVTRAVKNVNDKISEALVGMDPTIQSQIDQALIDLDKTEKKVFYFIITISFMHQFM